MMIAFPVLLALALAAMVLQIFLPPLGGAGGGAAAMVFPLFVFFGAVAFPYPAALLLAGATGLAWDLLTAQFVDGAFEIRPGTSMLIYGLLATVMHGFRPLYLRGRWFVHWLLCGVFTSAAILVEFLLLGYHRQSFAPFTHEVWVRILAPGVLTAALAPLVFFALAPLVPRRVSRLELGTETP